MDEGSDELEGKRAELASRQALQADVLLTTARGFAELLAGDATAVLRDLQTVEAKEEGKAESKEGKEEGWSTEELQAHAVETWRDSTLARAQGVLRRYHVAVAPLVEDVKVCSGGRVVGHHCLHRLRLRAAMSRCKQRLVACWSCEQRSCKH